MANIDISPYGQNAQMPEGYPIADNLTTNSAQQALSARQGKVLNEKTFSFSMIDLDSIETVKRFIRYDGKWVVYNDYSCKNIAVLPGETYRITAKSDTSAMYCVLSSSETFPDPIPEPPASFATGFSGYVTVQDGGSAEVTIPNDGAWLYICIYATVDKTPLVEKAFSLSDVVNTIDSLASKLKSEEVFVAANDAKGYEKAKADYQCDGVNDELTIQSAINAIYSAGGGTVRLSSGTFYIDSFPNYEANDDGGSYTAIMIPSNNTTGYTIRIIGDSVPYNSTSGKGTRIRVSDPCYEGLDQDKKCKIFRSPYVDSLVGKAKVALLMSDFGIYLPWNQKKIMCIDLLYTNRVELRRIYIIAYISGYNGHTVSIKNPPDVAVDGCVGLRMTGGSNAGFLNTYDSVVCIGFYEGIKVGGEHVIGLNLGGIFNVYSYTFGNYPWSDGMNHPITLINCSDERGVNLPLFAYCSEGRNNSASGQQISIIDFNVERIAAYTPGKQLGNLARELVPGTFHGDISYTIQYQYGGSPLSTTMKFWEDGHGQRFQSRNSTQLLACDTTTRNSYAPNYLQRIWDTTLGKEVICVDTANKTWKDAMGNTV